VRPSDIGPFLLANYLFASYLTPIRGGGLTINNVLGVILSVSMLAELSQRPDFWFLRRARSGSSPRSASSAAGNVRVVLELPDLASPGKVWTLDQTAELSRDFTTRFAFIILSAH
jgi:hypothetical protein